MSLQVWLPLNGNLNNQGLSDVTVINNGATVDNNGKIGKCYKFDGTYLTVSTGLPANPTIFSFCSWVKLISGYAVNNGCHLVALGNNCRICVSKDSAAIRFIGNNATVSCSSSVLSSNLIADVWYHVAVIFDNGNVRMYLNGVKVADSNIGATSLNLSNNMSTQVGSYSTELSKAYMNDFRIYDHALSEKEVKELAKGLVLHYRLAGPGQENLVKNSNKKIISGDYAVTSYELSETLVLNQIYTITMKAKLTPDLKWIGIWSDGGGTNFANCQARNENNFYKWTVTCNSSNSNHNIFTIFASNNNVGVMQGNTPKTGTCEIEWIKLEKGSIATPWCPNPADSLYSSLGFNSNIEPDCSGFGNNGTKSGTLIYNSNSPRYSSSYKFNTGVDYIKSAFTLSMSELSCSFWVKPNSSNGGYSIIASNYNNPPSGFWLAINTEGSGVWFYNGTYVQGASLLTNDVWHHCVFTFKNGIGTWYVNGTSVISTDISSRGKSLSINNLTVGNSYTGTSWNTKNYGYVSDFRFYATALSAGDIKELYNSSVLIDKSGNMYAYEYQEV